MIEGERHQMVLAKFYASGEQEWECPTCGRRLLFRWSSSYEPVVLVPGNPEADHGERKRKAPPPEPTVKHESGLSEVWRATIASLDMSGLPDTDPGLFSGR